MIHKLTTLLVALVLSAPVFSFTNQRIGTSFASVQLERSRGHFQIFSTEPENDGELGGDIPLPKTSVTTSSSSEPEGTQYPVDLPSPILLVRHVLQLKNDAIQFLTVYIPFLSNRPPP